MSEEQKKLSIEESFECLDDILDKLEDPDISLEDSFALYEKGMKVLKGATEAVDEVEKKIRLIDDNGEEEDFE